MRIVVLGGCGDMGSFVVRDLMAHSDAHVTIADYRRGAAEHLADGLGDRANAAFVDADDPESLVEALAGADGAVGCIGPFYRYAPILTRAAIRAGVPYVDICDDWGPMDELASMDDDARAAGVTVINGLGWTPGLTNLMAKKAAAQLEEVAEVRMYWAGGAADSQGLAVVMHLLYALTGDVPTVRGGRRIMVPAGSGRELVDFPAPLGAVEVFHCGHPETLTVPRVIAADTVFLKGGLTPRWNNWLATALVKLGLTRSHRSITRVSRITHRLEGVVGLGSVPQSGARVDVVGRRGADHVKVSYGVTDKMGRLTGIPAAVGAMALAQGEVAVPGVHAPEDILEPDRIFEPLEVRGIHIVEI